MNTTTFQNIANPIFTVFTHLQYVYRTFRRCL